MSEEKSTKPETDAKPPEAAPTVESLQAEVAEWKKKADEYLELARYAKADFINYQDRVRRDKADWQFTTIAHTPFEPVNNMAWFGWTHFRDEQIHPVRMLGWPLHAIGDATVPHHVTGTSACSVVVRS